MVNFTKKEILDSIPKDNGREKGVQFILKKLLLFWKSYVL